MEDIIEWNMEYVLVGLNVLINPTLPVCVYLACHPVDILGNATLTAFIQSNEVD